MGKFELNITERKEKFKLLLKDSDWEDILYPIIDSNEFGNIIFNLITDVNKDIRFTPKFKDIFNAFIECKFKNTKVIILGQDPYPGINAADGLAFSCSIKGIPEKSLRYIFDALYGNHNNKDCDLRRWAHQGVLLLNTALTVRIGIPGSHFLIWKSLMINIFTEINKNFNKIPIILFGKRAQEFDKIFTNQEIFKCQHPAAAAYNDENWEYNDVFNKVNDYLISINKQTINW